MPKPCLIVFSALRSGTTMLRLMLDSHPRVACTGEHDFLFDFLAEGPEGWTYDRAAMKGDRIFRYSGLALRDDLEGEALLADLIRQICEKGQGKPVLMLHRNLDRAVRLLPEVPILHMLRDPRDVARSAVGMIWADHVYFGVNSWLRTETEWEALGSTLEHRTLTIHYELLVAQPRDTLASICAHVGIDFDEQMLTYDRQSTYAPPDPSLAEQWRRKLRPVEVRLVEGKVGPLLVARGYKPSGEPPLTPSSLHILWLRIRNRTGVWRRRAAIYGWRPMLKRRLGMTFGLPDMRQAAEREMEAITLKRLK